MPTGHCVVAITKEEIKSSEDVYGQLKDAILVEPQGGFYMADMKDTSMIDLFKDGEDPSSYYVSIVILPEDIVYFYRYTEEDKWTSYSDFLEVMQEHKNGLAGLMR
jgi:hypothetical protein